jgi:hypothetical protein
MLICALVAATVVAAGAAGLAQGPLHTKIHYTINVPHELAFCDYLLPPGRYELYQVNTTDLNLFALYPEDMTHSPLALIRTKRQTFKAGIPPEATKIRLEFDETSPGARPVLRGWTVPGDEGWEIVSVDAKDKKLVRIK